MDELERLVSRIYGPPIISTLSNKNGVFKEKRHNNKWNLGLAQFEHNNR